MVAGIYDSFIFGDGYGTAEMRKIFDDEQIIGNWIKVEVSLAKCQAKLGIIPQEAANEIAAKANIKNFDFVSMKNSKNVSGHNIVSLVKTLQKNCKDNLGEYIHWGATTQDIMDSGLSLAIRDGLQIIERDTHNLHRILLRQAKLHRNTLMVGRTHGQHAVPITLGYKVAVWAEEIRRHIERIERCKKIGPVLELSGAAGTLATIDPSLGFALQEMMAEDLGLQKPVITWHTSRDGFAETVYVMAMISATVGKIANEVLNLQKTEVGELEEPWKLGDVGSSTMPHKRNPSKTENIYLLSKMVKIQVPLILEAMVMEHEREWFSRGCEMKVLAEVFMLTAAVLRDIITVMDGLVVNIERMKKNLEMTKGLLMSERAMMLLGEKIGRQTAHEIIYEACQTAYKEGCLLKELLKTNETIKANITEEEIDSIFNPSEYLGLAPAYVDRICD